MTTTNPNVVPPPFTWDLTSEQMIATTTQIIEDTKKMYERVVAVMKDERTYENTILPLLTAPNFKTDDRVMHVKFPSFVSADEQVRKAGRECQSRLSSFRVECASRKDVYDAVREFQSNEALVAQLDERQRFVLDQILARFERNGLSLSENDRKRFVELRQEIAQLAIDYSSNIANTATKLFFSVEQLAGMPSDFVESLERDSDGRLAVTMSYPHVLPILENCTVSETRREVWVAFRQRGMPDNLDCLQNAIGLRKQVGELLGFESFAHFVMQDRMASGPDYVNDFLDNLAKQLSDRAKVDLALLVDAKNEWNAAHNLPADGKIYGWDKSFFIRVVTEKMSQLDSELVRQHFPLKHVVATTLQIYQDLLGVTFHRLDDVPLWHPDAVCYAVTDTASGQSHGSFYLDLHPREGKYSHAAVFRLGSANASRAPVCAMLCNFPTGVSLMPHNQVVTFFHEFGHVMHDLLCLGEANGVMYAKVPRDFVEAPSQMLENWVWTRPVLKLVSKHHESGEPLSDELCDAIIRSKNVLTALSYSRQIALSSFDMALHGTHPPSSVDELQALEVRTMCDVALAERPPPGTSFAASFGHIMGGYAAGYNGYLLSQVLSADMWAQGFGEAKVFDKDSGAHYRREILEPGGYRTADEMVRRFLGRDWNHNAFLRSIGL